MIGDEVPHQLSDPVLVVAADVQRRMGRGPGKSHDWDHVGQPCDSDRRKHAVVQDQAVRLSRQRGDPRRHVVVVEPDGADQQVESAAACPNLDTAVDDVDEEKALVFALEQRLASTPKDNADDFLEPVGQSARRPLRTRDTDAMETPARLATS
jgi:hypothetical protein